MSENIDAEESKKIEINKQLFSIYNSDHFEINSVLKILNEETLPVDISLNNNQVFIRDLTNFIVKNNIELKPNINKKQ